MARWAFHAYDLASGQRNGTLPLRSWQHTNSLNDSGPFSAEMLPGTRFDNRVALASTQPARSTVIPTRNGQLLGYEGLIWTRDAPTLGGASLLSYYDQRRLDQDKTFSQEDQHRMVKWFVDNHPGALVDTSQVVDSGVPRDQAWSRWQSKNIGEAIRQKGDNLGGYDFDIRPELATSGLPVRRLRLWTPRRGRVYQAGASPAFSWGANLLDVPKQPQDGTRLITHQVALGKEDPTTGVRLYAIGVRQDLLDAGYPRLDGPPLDLPDVSLQATLQQHADGAAGSSTAVGADTFTISVDPDHPGVSWGTWDLGDDCWVDLPAGKTPWIPDGREGVFRIVGDQWTWRGGERLDLILGRVL